MNRKKRWKQGLLAVLIMSLIFTLISCGKEQVNKEKDTGSKSTAKGRYTEQEINFNDTDILKAAKQGSGNADLSRMSSERSAMKGLDDGTLRIAARTGIFDSSDKGGSWKPWAEIPQELTDDLTSEEGIEFIAISGKGALFYAAGGEYKMVEADGSIRAVNPELPPKDTEGSGMVNSVRYAVFTDSGDILCQDENNIYQLDDVSLSLKHTYGQETAEGQEALNNFLQDEFLNSSVLSGADGKSLYFISQSGIYRYMTDGTAVEKIFNGSMGQMNSNTFFANKATVLTDGTIFIPYHINEQERLFCYSFDPEASLRPEHTITVYSLYDNLNIRKLITEFQSQHSDVMVEYETGMTGEDAVTRSDALKTLNTNIMAGEGPDVLILDGLPISSYIEKGLLMDIGDLVEEADKAEGLFGNIVNAYKTDGSLLAVPTSFSIPVLIGRQSALEEINSLEELALAAEKDRENSPENSHILGSMTNSTLLLTLISSSSPSWVTEEGTLDKKALTDFFENAKRIAAAQNAPDNMEYSDTESQPLELSPFMTSAHLNTLEMGYTNSYMTISNLMSAEGLSNILSMAKYLGGGGYKSTPGQSEHVFIPLSPVGISSKTDNEETAGEFVSYLITEGQHSSSITSWPVNRTAFAGRQELPSNFPVGMTHMESDVDGSGFDLEIIPPAKEDYDALQNMIGTLTTPAVTDDIINRTVMTEGLKCLSQETSVSDTVDAILKKVNLYLAE